MIFKRVFESHLLWFLYWNRDTAVAYQATPPAYHLQSVLIRHFVSFIKRNRSVRKIEVLNIIKTLHPIIRNRVVAVNSSQYAHGRSRVTVGIIASSRRDLNSLRKIPVSVEQSEHHPGSIDFCIDIKWGHHSSGTEVGGCPFAAYPIPTKLPVFRIFCMQCNNVIDYLMEIALLRYDVYSSLYYCLDIIFYESERVHGGDKNTSIPTVTIVHYVANFVANLYRRINHAGGHHAGKICLNLKIDIICGRVIQPMTRFWRSQAVENIVSRNLIREPKAVFSICK